MRATPKGWRHFWEGPLKKGDRCLSICETWPRELYGRKRLSWEPVDLNKHGDASAYSYGVIRRKPTATEPGR